MRYESSYKTKVLRDDELMHWKYIKREKINGKWRYYYDIGQRAKSDYKEAERNYNRTSENWDRLSKITNKLGAKALANPNNESKSKARVASKASTDAYERYLKAVDKLQETKTSYMSSPLYKLEQMGDKISAGARAIAKLFSKKKK